MNWSTGYSESKTKREEVATNVFVSGLVYGGNPGKVVRLVKELKLRAVVSPDTAVELVTKLKKFNLAARAIEDLVYVIDTEGIKVVPRQRLRKVRDPKDNMFLEAAQQGKADYLITGDKDLLVLKQFRRTKIVKPKEFLATIDTGGESGG